MTTDAAQALLQRFCADLRLLWTQAGGPTLRTLSARVRLGKSQVGNILSGRVRRPPDWPVVSGLVTCFLRHAQERGRVSQLSVSTGVEEFWRPRYAMVEYSFRQMDPLPGGVAVTAHHAAERGPDWVVQHQLPGAVPHFTGRTDELETLTKLVDQGVGRAVVIAAIDGAAGIGKTALAVHWAHAVAERFPDGQLYVNLRGFDPTGPPMTAAEALRVFLDGLSVPPGRIPASLEAQVGLFRTLLSGKRVLVVLDNARDVAQVRPLLPASPTALAIVTSRNRLTGLVVADGAHPITLDLLSAAQSQDLLTTRLGYDRGAAAPAAVEEIIDRCAGLPLALAIVAARAAGRPRLPLAALADELRDAGARLDALDGGEATADLRTVFSWSYHQLSSPAARLFRLLGLHPGPDCGAAAAASLAELPAGTTRLLAELTRAHLVTEHTPGRYTLHDLLRAYASELAHNLDPAAERQAAVRRMLDHYLHSACAADRRLYPRRETIVLPPPGPGVVDDVADRRPTSWFATEHLVLLAAVQQAFRAGFDAHVYQLASAISGFLDWRGHWRDLVGVQRAALAAARRGGNRPEQAQAERTLGSAFKRLGSYDDAHTHLGNALGLYRALDDRVSVARTHLHIGEVFDRHGRYAQALHHARQALEVAQAADDPKWYAKALNATGWYHAQLGEYREALIPCRQALALQDEIGDRGGAADTWDSLGYAHHHLGEFQQAIECYQRALTLWQETDAHIGQADTLVNLGHTLVALDRSEAAREAWRQALVILEDLAHPDAERVRASLHDLDLATP